MFQFQRKLRLNSELENVNELIINDTNTKDEIIITSGRRRMKIVDLSSGEIKKAWYMESTKCINAGAVFDSALGLIYCIVDETYIWSWSFDDANLKSAKVQNLKKPAVELLLVDKWPLCVIYNDSTISFHDSNDLTYGQSLQCCVKAIRFSIHMGVLYFVVITDDIIRIISLSNNNNFIIRDFSLDGLIGCTLFCLQSRPMGLYLIGFHADKYFVEVNCSEVSPNAQINPRDVSHVKYSQEIVCCSVIDSTTLVVGAISSTQDMRVGTLDVRLFDNINWCDVGEETHANSSNIYLNVLGSNVIVCGEYMNVAILNNDAISLRKMLGKQKLVTSVNGFDLVNSNDIKRSDLPHLLSCEVNFKEFMESESFIISLIYKSLQATSECYDILCDLMVKKLIPSNTLKDIIPFLILNGEMKCILALLVHAQCFPEEMIALVLGFLLKKDESVFIPHSSFFSQHSDGNNETDFYKNLSLTILLTKPFSEYLMVIFLKNVEFDDILKLIEFLMLALTSQIAKENGFTSDKILDWLSMILDAHYTQIILSPDARYLLIQLHNLVNSHLSFHNELVHFDSLLETFNNDSLVNCSKYVGDYNIHVLHIF